jgi:predicted metal-binding membrane protein
MDAGPGTDLGGLLGWYLGIWVTMTAAMMLLSRRRAHVAAGALAAAGAYQLTPLKELCLRHCRSPLHVLMHKWRESRLGALRQRA